MLLSFRVNIAPCPSTAAFANLTEELFAGLRSLAMAGAKGVTYEQLDGLQERIIDPEEYKQFRNRVQRVVCRLNERLSKGSIPLEVRPLSKKEYVLTPAGTLKRRYVKNATA